jgi:hypothetical protein
MIFKYVQSKGQCQVCKKVNHTSIWQAFEKVNWFRGDDEYKGKVCKHCKKIFEKQLKEVTP